MSELNTPSIASAIDSYLENIQLARSENTAHTYRYAIECFIQSLTQHNLPINSTSLIELPEESIGWFATDLKQKSPATEMLYLTAISGFFEFLVAERLAEINLPHIRMLIRQRGRRAGQRLPQFPRDNIVEILKYAINLASQTVASNDEHLRNMRDRAFLITLADTGLRVHEACGLRRGDIDWNEARAIIIGKGNRQAVVRFSQRTLKALKEYLFTRASLDGASGRPLASLPLFARHDTGAGKKIKAITTTTGRNIVNQRVAEALGKDAVGSITPHSFRHYFVTTVLQSSGNLKLAQELARHRSITVTQRYAHLSDDELDQGYWEIFEDN